MCIPKQCNKEDLKKSWDSHYINMAQAVNWTDVTVDYYLASDHDSQQANQSSTGVIITLLLLGIVFLLSIVGTIFELTSLGDKKGLDYSRLNPIAKFYSVK